MYDHQVDLPGEHIRHRRTSTAIGDELNFLTGCLLVVAVVLLFGIFSQFQPPAATVPPRGVTVIDYSTFVRQVKARNVLAVIIL